MSSRHFFFPTMFQIEYVMHSEFFFSPRNSLSLTFATASLFYLVLFLLLKYDQIRKLGAKIWFAKDPPKVVCCAVI